MDKKIYDQCHLFVAAIRIIEFKNSTPPSLRQICDTLSISAEHASMLCRKLEDVGALEVVEGAFGTRLVITDHLKIEEISKTDDDSSLAKELKKFKETRSKLSEKVESIKTEQQKKQQDLFAELQKKFKEGLKK